MTLYHEGSDGLTLEYVEILTTTRIAYCSVGFDLDGDVFATRSCI